MIEIKKEMDLKQIVFSGACFRVEQKEDFIILIVNDRILKIKETLNTYQFYSNNEENLKEKIFDYFDLNRDYKKINKKIIQKDKEIKHIIEISKNYRILNQDKFEMYISYIISQNNNVKKITYSINKISEMFGKKICYEGEIYYLFPTFEEIKNINLEDLKICKVGFRDKYIMEALNVIKDNPSFLEDLERMDTNSAYEKLLKIKGIGPKVASCILMFGFSRLDVFPIDTWVKKNLIKKYKVTNIKKLQGKLYEKYGEFVGLIIQYIYNYERNLKKDNI